MSHAPVVWTGMLTLLLIFGSALPQTNFFPTPAHYLPFHSFLEILSIAISGMVFGLAWSLRFQGNNSQHILFSFGFLAVCLIDTAHTLSYPGMPDLITPSSPEKAINFWLVGRYVGALTLLAVAFMPPRRWPKIACHGALVAALLVAAGVVWVEVVHGDWLPRTFVAGRGLTPFKINAEYLVATFYAVAAIGFYWQGRCECNPNLIWLAAAAWILGLAEMFFTMYTNLTDIFNLLGHLYKTIAYLIIYRAVFVAGVSAPYRELEYERSWLQTLFASIPDPVWLKDVNGVYLAHNLAYVEKFSKDATAVIGKTDHDLFGIESAEESRRHDQRVIESRQPLRVEACVQPLSGEQLVLDTIQTPMYLPNGELIGVLGITHDITMHKRTEAELEQHRDHLETLVEERTLALSAALADAEAANKAKSTFLSNMSHELRTPLNAVIGFSRLMAKSETLSTAEKKSLQIINRSGNHLLTLINEVLELSKIDAGHIGHTPVATDLVGLAQEITDMLRPRAEQGGLALNLEMMNLPAMVQVDAVKLRQVLINLMSNAVKFTQQGSVTLSVKGVSSSNGAVDIGFAVSDTGIGIAAEDQQKVLEPFVQLETHATSAGTGLGLSITRQYLRMLGGDLKVESTPGVGSCFHFTLQLRLVEPPPVAALATSQAAGIISAQGKKILIVEDNPDARELLVQLLTPLGFDIAEALNGAEAVDMTEAFLPDLIVTDWRMPVMDGLEATRRIRALPLSRQPTIVMLSANAFEEERKQAVAAGIDVFLRKPLEDDLLMAAINQYLGITLGRPASAEPLVVSEPFGIDANALSTIPVQMRNELRSAVEELNPVKIKMILQDLKMMHPQIASDLAGMVDNFKYRELCGLLSTEG